MFAGAMGFGSGQNPSSDGVLCWCTSDVSSKAEQTNMSRNATTSLAPIMSEKGKSPTSRHDAFAYP